MVILTRFDLGGNCVSDPFRQKAIQFDEQVDWKRKEIGLLYWNHIGSRPDQINPNSFLVEKEFKLLDQIGAFSIWVIGL